MTSFVSGGYQLKDGKLTKVKRRKSAIEHIKSNSKAAKKRTRVASPAKAKHLETLT